MSIVLKKSVHVHAQILVDLCVIMMFHLVQVVVFHDLIKWFSMARNTIRIHSPVVCGYVRDVPGESCCQIDNKVGCLSCIVLVTSSKKPI